MAMPRQLDEANRAIYNLDPRGDLNDRSVHFCVNNSDT